jgi:hypothetical protein
MKEKMSIGDMERVHDSVSAAFNRIANELSAVRKETEEMDYDASRKIQICVGVLKATLYEIQDYIETERRNANRNAVVNKKSR